MIYQLQKIVESSDQLLKFALSDAWDDFELEAVKYQSLTTKLSDIDWSKYSASDQALMQRLLNELKYNHEKMLPLVQQWRLELESLLHSQVRNRKLNTKYR